jgi:hypothetical protein
MEVRINGRPAILRPLTAAQAQEFSEWADADELRRARQRAAALPHRAAEIIDAAYDRIATGDAATAAQGTLAGRRKLASLSLGRDAGEVLLADLLRPEFLAAVLGNESGPASPEAAVAEQERRRAEIFRAMAEKSSRPLAEIDDAELVRLYADATGLTADAAKIRARLQEWTDETR